MDDMISRQAAINALDVLCQEHRYKIPGKRETYSQYNEAWQDALDRAEGAIFNLPTVQPDHVAEIGKKAEGDCISRQAALDMLDEQIEMCNKALSAFDISLKDEYAIKVERASLKAYKEQLENMPSVQPEPHGGGET